MRTYSIFMGAMIVAILKMASAEDLRPNIIWIVAEDASPHLGCYGTTTIATPHLDRLAEAGVLFENAFVTCPVCSPSRSAMFTGVFQTTLGAHHHRSQGTAGKARGTRALFTSYRLPVKSIPRLFQEAGYYTCNSATGQIDGRRGKTDYNFVWDNADYNGIDWSERAKGQPFFAQVQLRGG